MKKVCGQWLWTKLWGFDKIYNIPFCQSIFTIDGILLPKLFWPTVRKNCSSDQENLLKFSAFCLEFANVLRSLEQVIQRMKGQNNFLEQLEFKFRKNWYLWF